MTILLRHFGAVILSLGCVLTLVACGATPPSQAPPQTNAPTIYSRAATVPAISTTTPASLPTTVAPPPPPVITEVAPPRPPHTASKERNCDPAYPTVCIPSPPPDLDCPDIPFKRFKVLNPDPHRFDADHDGIGCEK